MNYDDKNSTETVEKRKRAITLMEELLVVSGHVTDATTQAHLRKELKRLQDEQIKYENLCKDISDADKAEKKVLELLSSGDTSNLSQFKDGLLQCVKTFFEDWKSHRLVNSSSSACNDGRDSPKYGGATANEEDDEAADVFTIDTTCDEDTAAAGVPAVAIEAATATAVPGVTAVVPAGGLATVPAGGLATVPAGSLATVPAGGACRRPGYCACRRPGYCACRRPGYRACSACRRPRSR
jgi:hypothetical protein